MLPAGRRNAINNKVLFSIINALYLPISSNVFLPLVILEEQLSLTVHFMKYANSSVVLWFLAATKQLYEWYFLSVCPSVRLSVRLSVCPSVRLSHLFTRGQFWPSGIVIACVCGSVCPCVCVCV